MLLSPSDEIILVMTTKISSEEQFNQLRAFRQAIYANFTKAADCAFELIDALLTTPEARSFADLTTSILFRRGWSSAYKAMQQLIVNKEALYKLRLDLLPKDKPLVFAIDATTLSRATAYTLDDRIFAFTAADLPGTDNITAGHCYSTVAYLAEEKTSWALPLIQERITSKETASAKAVEQIKRVCADLATSDLLFLLDSGYANKTLLEMSKDLKVKMVIRWRSNTNLYRLPKEAQSGQKGRKADHGAVFKINDPTTYGECAEKIDLVDEKLGAVTVQMWRDLHMEKCKGVNVQLICITQHKASTKRGRKPLWVIWVGEGMPPLEECWPIYLRRYGIEHWYRFSKQYLFWELPKLGTTTQEENWNELVINAMWMLWLSRGIAEDRRKPWQHVQIKAKMTPGRVKMGMGVILAILGTPTKAVKPRGNAPGWEIGRKRKKREIHEVIRRGEQRKRNKKKELKRA